MANNQKWTAADEKRLAEAWEAGENVEVLARELGRSPLALRQHARKLGVRRPARGEASPVVATVFPELAARERESKAEGPELKKRARQKTRRVCLRCDREFMSEGKHHRLCNYCREASAEVTDWSERSEDHRAFFMKREY